MSTGEVLEKRWRSAGNDLAKCCKSVEGNIGEVMERHWRSVAKLLETYSVGPSFTKLFLICFWHPSYAPRGKGGEQRWSLKTPLAIGFVHLCWTRNAGEALEMCWRSIGEMLSKW